MAHIDELTIVVQRNPNRENPISAFIPEIYNDEGVEGKTVIDVVFASAEKVTAYLNEMYPDSLF